MHAVSHAESTTPILIFFVYGYSESVDSLTKYLTMTFVFGEGLGYRPLDFASILAAFVSGFE